MRTMIRSTLSWHLAALICLACLAPVAAIEQVTVKQAGLTRILKGKILVEAEDGGVLLLTQDGRLWPLPKEEILSRSSDAKLFQPLTKAEFNKQLLAGLPQGFKIHQTKHYSIAYNTSLGYAQWVGALYERLYSAFYVYWPSKGAELKEPEFPLAAIVFDTRASYEQYARTELGASTATIMGYYSLPTNMVTMYDLTGQEESQARISRILSQPNAERNVATIVHEATHQLAFNSGLQQRFTDTPFWVSEGLAVYFETPDLDNAKGWKKIGAVNRYNLINFKKYLRNREPGALSKLLSDDKRFRDPATQADAYAEAWALNYYLINTHGETYAKYLKVLSAQTPLVMQEPAARQEQFLKLFGKSLEELENDFLKYMRSVE
ncbi:DUF1570 domain-containing protein [Anatilimnocola floriformis]|uniref:DUF1570 domain-containing protein n=1 Tax=Anatilimnocola floriformis TaxID=2948575 RepID=UPI0020C35C96|nr:DUF1570 domain-containing protein [Anatilimnocola floriformis]